MTAPNARVSVFSALAGSIWPQWKPRLPNSPPMSGPEPPRVWNISCRAVPRLIM